MWPEYCERAAKEEVINDPSNPRHYWQFRFHVTLEDLISNKQFVADIHDMLLRTERSLAPSTAKDKLGAGVAEVPAANLDER